MIMTNQVSNDDLAKRIADSPAKVWMDGDTGQPHVAVKPAYRAGFNDVLLEVAIANGAKPEDFVRVAEALAAKIKKMQRKDNGSN